MRWSELNSLDIQFVGSVSMLLRISTASGFGDETKTRVASFFLPHLGQLFAIDEQINDISRQETSEREFPRINISVHSYLCPGSVIACIHQLLHVQDKYKHKQHRHRHRHWHQQHQRAMCAHRGEPVIGPQMPPTSVHLSPLNSRTKLEWTRIWPN